MCIRDRDYSETGYGVSLMNDCKYGYSARGHVLGMSLIKCGIYPDYAADQGSHDFTYALYPCLLYTSRCV